MLVRIIKDWQYPDIYRQTPQWSGIWDGIEFTLKPVRVCDYVIVLNKVPKDTKVYCAPENIWAIMQEPPEKEREWIKNGFGDFAKIVTSDSSLIGKKFVHDCPALPWHVDRTYEQLSALERPRNKVDLVSWVTSNKGDKPGHKQRLQFLKAIENDLQFDLFGHGFKPIKDKFNALHAYKYSLAVENFCGFDYWTEKIADCYLSWTMPIYYGCKNIERYFPQESFISIDIEKPNQALQIIQKAMSDKLWEKNIEAIEHSRNLILNRYQLFPYVSGMIKRNEFACGEKKLIRLNGLKKPTNRSFPEKLMRLLKRYRSWG